MLKSNEFIVIVPALPFSSMSQWDTTFYAEGILFGPHNHSVIVHFELYHDSRHVNCPGSMEHVVAIFGYSE